MTFPHTYSTPIVHLGEQEGFYVAHGVSVPPALVEWMKERRLRRIAGHINGRPFELAMWGRAGEEERYLMISRQKMREIKALPGEIVQVTCAPVENPDEVALPEELAEVLRQDEAAAARFEKMTAGRRRSLAYYVSSAKGIDTRVNRAVELARQLRTYTLYGDLNPTGSKRRE
jgi:hypothetical protein